MKKGIKIKGVRCTEIEWCVELEDVIGTDDMTEEEINDAIGIIEDDLPDEVYLPLDNPTSDLNDLEEFVGELSEVLSDKYGWLVVGYNYKLIGEDDKEYNLK